MANLSEIKKDSNWGEAASTINSNFLNMNVDLEKVKSATTKFRGYFTSESVLKQKYPSPQVGDTAYVGEPYPGTVYDVQVAGTWHNTGKVPDTETVDLTEYAKKEELTELENNVGLYNVDKNVPLGSGFYTSTTARAAVPSTVRKLGLIITYKTDAKTSVTEQFTGSDISAWSTEANWSKIGGSEGGNKILEWNTDVATTRKQVSLKDRKELLIVSYKDGDGNIVNEQYIGDEFDDENWMDDTNWQSFEVKKDANIVIIKGIDNYNNKQYLLQDGRMIASGSKSYEYTLDFYKVKRGVKIRVYSMAAYDKAIIAFYKDKDESSFVECVKAYNNHETSSFVSLISADYTPKDDGYIRVYSVNDIVETDNGLIIPTIAIGEESIIQLENDIKQNDESLQDIEIEGYDDDYLKHKICLQYNSIFTSSTDINESVSKLIRVKKGDKVKIYTNARKTDEINSFQFFSEEDAFKCTYSLFGNGYDKVVDIDYTVQNTGYIIVYNNKVYGEEYGGKSLPYIKIVRSTEEDNNQEFVKSVTSITELEGVEDYSLENLFDKNNTRTYDSEFANKVESAIGRKTDSTGCYSNNIPCKIGDYFTRNDFGTGIVVVLDGNENILGDIKNVAYTPTIQIVESEGQDFTDAVSVVFVVPVANVDTEKIVKAKYLPTEQGDYFKMPKFRLDQLNIPNGLDYPIKSTSGRFYSIIVDDSGEEPILKYVLQEGIPMSDLPQNFPLFSMVGDFSKYYDYLIFCPIEGGVTNYLYQLSSAGLVARYINKKVNCPRILKEKGTWYFYGVDGSLNSSSGKLNIYKANGETFELVKGDLGNSKGESIEPHDCLLISVEPLHYICQRYVPNQTTTVNGEGKVVTALHLEEIYEGESVWEWHSEDYPELWTDSHVQGNNADYLHNNSISIANDGNLYLNNKQANQILVLKRTWDEESHTGSIGEILWKIGGNDDHEGWDVSTRIKTEGSQQWFESHDAIINSDNTITMFDNGYIGTSRILNFSIDTEKKYFQILKVIHITLMEVDIWGLPIKFLKEFILYHGEVAEMGTFQMLVCMTLIQGKHCLK